MLRKEEITEYPSEERMVGGILVNSFHTRTFILQASIEMFFSLGSFKMCEESTHLKAAKLRNSDL